MIKFTVSTTEYEKSNGVHPMFSLIYVFNNRKFEVFMVVKVYMLIFWVYTSTSISTSTSTSTMKMKAVDMSKMLVNTSNIT